MNKQNCQYSQLKKSGLEQSLFCSLTGKYCTKQRYCTTQRRLVNTDDWQSCIHLKKEELQMANKKTTSNNNRKYVEKKVANITEMTKSKVIEEVTEPKDETNLVTEVKPKVEQNTELRVAKYEVILARPTYFIINKNGLNITINKKNNYKKGDIITL